MRTSLLALLFVPVFAFGDIRVETRTVRQPVSAGGGIRLTVPDVQPETSAWQRAVIINGGSYNAADVRAVDYFVRETKAKGIWPLLDWVALFAGQNLNAALVPLKRTVGDTVITNSNFIEMDFSPTFGLTGNTTNKFLTPGFNQNQCRAADDVSFGQYITVKHTSGVVRSPFSSAATSGSRLHFVTSSGGNDFSVRLNQTNTVSVNTAGIGFTGASRIPSESANYVFVGTAENSVVQTNTIVTSPMNLFCRGSSDFYNGTLGGAWFGGGLTSHQRADFHIIWNRTMNLLARSATAEGAAWAAAVIANGGTYNAQDIQAVDYFVTECKALGVWDKLDWVNLFAGRNLNAALVSLKYTVGSQVVTNNNFVEADFAPVLGLSGNGSNKDLNPGLNRDQCRASDDVCFGVYVTGIGDIGAARGLMGTTNANGLVIFAASSGVINCRLNSITTAITTILPAIGLCIGNKVQSENVVVAMGSTESSFVRSTGMASAAMRIMSAGGQQYNSGSIGFAAFGAGLITAERATFLAIVNQTMAILGRPTL